MHWTRLPLRRKSASGREVAPAPAPSPEHLESARRIACLRRRLTRDPGLRGAAALAITRQLLALQGEPQRRR